MLDGSFTITDIGGRAYAVDAQTVLIKGFTYDGEGPDTFFLAGTGGRPSAAGELVLPWPADGKQYQYRWQQLHSSAAGHKI